MGHCEEIAIDMAKTESLTNKLIKHSCDWLTK